MATVVVKPKKADPMPLLGPQDIRIALINALWGTYTPFQELPLPTQRWYLDRIDNFLDLVGLEVEYGSAIDNGNGEFVQPMSSIRINSGDATIDEMEEFYGSTADAPGSDFRKLILVWRIKGSEWRRLAKRPVKASKVRPDPKAEIPAEKRVPIIVNT